MQQDKLGKLGEGSFQIHLEMAGRLATIRLNISEGNIRSLNAFAGTSRKVIGKLIELG